MRRGDAAVARARARLRASAIRSVMDAAEARRLHWELRREEPLLGESTFLSNLIVQMYARCGSLREAEAAFAAMASPNDFSRNIMIQAYSKAGDLVKAKEMFDRVESDGDGEAAAVGRTTMLVAYAHKGLAEQAKAMFDGIKHRRDVVAWTALLAASSRLDQAQEVFRRMPGRNVVSFNAMLVACDRGDRLDLAKATFDDIPRGGANVLSWNTLLSALARHGRLADAWRAFHKIPARVTETWNAMIAAVVAAAAVNSAALASSLFQQIPEPNVVSWTTMVTAYSQSGDLLRAKETFDKMPLAPNVVSWTCLLHAYCTNGDLVSAEELFKRRMPRRSVVAWATMVQGYASSGHLGQAKATFQAMPQHNDVAWNTMIQAYGRAGRTAEARAMYDASPVPCNEVAFTVVIAMYAAAGQLDEAAALFFDDGDGDEQQGRARNVVNWNAMVAAYAQAGRGREAVELYRRMCVEGVEPDGVTFMSVLPACSYQGLVGTGLVELQRMDVDFGLRPTEEHYCCLVDGLARSGQLAMAEELAAASIPSSPVAMAALLAASRTQRDVDRAYRIGGLAINRSAEALTSGAPYTLLASSLDG